MGCRIRLVDSLLFREKGKSTYIKNTANSEYKVIDIQWVIERFSSSQKCFQLDREELRNAKRFIYATVSGMLKTAMNKLNIYNEIDALWKDFVEIRATFLYARESHIGTSIIRLAPYYRNYGFDYKLEFDHILKESDIQRIRHLGYWINQSSTIRLYAIINSNNILSDSTKIMKAFDGHEEMDILRRFRNRFAHGGNYNPKKKYDKVLFERLVKHFNLVDYDVESLPIPIDRVLEPLFEKVKVCVGQL